MRTDIYSILTPDEGMMLYNEEKNIYSDKTYIGRLDSVENWREVPISQYEEYLAEEERKAKEQLEAALAESPKPND